jgi:hypothetical protein
MEDSVCFACVHAFQKALASPVGEVFASIFDSLSPAPDDSVNIFKVLDRLIANSYPSPTDWMDDLTATTNNAMRYFGEGSEVSIAILTIRQQICNLSKPVFADDCGSSWSAIHKLSTFLSSFVATVPDDIDSYRDFVSPEAPPLSCPTVAKPSQPSQFEPIDPAELKSMIHRLPTDEDLVRVGKLIARYQPEYSNPSGVVDLDLKQCHPYTLHLVYEYVRPKVPALPPKPEIHTAPLPRRTSPLPQTILNRQLQIPSAPDLTDAFIGSLSPAAILAMATLRASPFLAIASSKPPPAESPKTEDDAKD